MASTYLQRIVESGSTGKKWTFSVWLKLSGVRGGSGVHNQIWNCSSDDDSTKYIEICIKNTDKLDMQFRKGTSGDNGTFIRRITNKVFRDPNAWYHLVMRMDTTQSSASDRFRVYINNEQVTSWDTETGTIPLNYETEISTTGSENRIGRGAGSSSAYWDGSMSHLHFCDDYSYAPTEFGSTDSTTGEWKITTSPSVSYGTNGFFIFKDGTNLSGSTVQDQSGQSHNLTVEAGTLTKTEDNPSNVFATMNPLGTYDGTLSNGNTRVKTNQTNYRYIASTLGVSSGRYYWECKLQEIGNYMLCGITDQPSFPASGVTMLGNSTYDCAVYTGDQSANGGNGHLYHSSTSNASNTNTPGAFMSAFSQGDILTFALDLDSATKKLYIGVGGNWANGSGSTNQTFANATGVSIVVPQNTNTGFYFPACGDYSGTYGHWEYNFGNGYFGTTAVASAGSNASGLGIFEYDVPTGYTALCTKGLNE